MHERYTINISPLPLDAHGTLYIRERNKEEEAEDVQQSYGRSSLAVHTQEEEEEERNETLNPQTLKTQSLTKREAFFAQKGVLCRFFHKNRLIFENVQTPGTGDVISFCFMFYFILQNFAILLATQKKKKKSGTTHTKDFFWKHQIF